MDQALATLNNETALNLVEFLKALGVSIVLGLATAACYLKFSSAFSNRVQYFKVIPIIAIATCIIISVIKSSLALSLGLVGALSIVRFRTAVKDPEELTYLFTAIVIGIGSGAGLYARTALGVVILLAIIALFSISRLRVIGSKSQVLISLQTRNANEVGTEKMRHVLSANSSKFDFKKAVFEEDSLEVLVTADLKPTTSIDTLVKELRDKTYPNAIITFTNSQDASIWNET